MIAILWFLPLLVGFLAGWAGRTMLSDRDARTQERIARLELPMDDKRTITVKARSGHLVLVKTLGGDIVGRVDVPHIPSRGKG